MHKLLALLAAAGLAYPPAPRGDVVDDLGGRKIAAPWRWMEDLDAPEVKKWVEAETCTCAISRPAATRRTWSRG